MMTAALIILGIITACTGGGVLAATLVMRWVAKGEADVNGDPERDSGLTDAQIAQSVNREALVVEKGTAALRPGFEERITTRRNQPTTFKI